MDTPPPAAPAGTAPVWVVVTTLPDEGSARRLGQALVEARLAACAQVEVMHSIYRWDGALASDDEARLVLKTPASRRDALMDAVQAAHPYALPQLLAWACDVSSPAYAQWVASACEPAPPAAGRLD